MSRFEVRPVYQIEEALTNIATDKLKRIARLLQKKCMRDNPLPQPFTVGTYRTTFGVSGFIGKFQRVSEPITPVSWEPWLFGRCNRKLAIGIKFSFTRNQSTFWNLRRKKITQHSDHLKRTDLWADIDDAILPDEINFPTLFLSNVELFPLTAQQAAFAGCKITYPADKIIWGIQSDVDALKSIPSHLLAA